MGINERLEKLEKELEGNVKTKKWKLPFKARVNKKRARKNWVGVLKINENGSIEPLKKQIDEQTIVVDDVPRIATPDYILRWNAGKKQFPVIIQPSWSVLPFNPKDNQASSMLDGSNAKGYKLLMNRMQLSKVEGKTRDLGWVKWVAGALLLGVIAYAFMSGKM